MLFDDLCLKIYFWPFLSYLASLKGLCPFYPPIYFPIITLPPNTTLTSTSPIPTYQPTPPSTLPPCPADPLVCLPGGERPISYCPCIDPRQQNGQTTTAMTSSETAMTSAEADAMDLQNLQFRLATTHPTAVMGSEMMIFSHLKTRKRRKRRKRDTRKKKKY